MDGDILGSICEVIDAGRVSFEEPMDRHTTFRVGGKADVLVNRRIFQRLRQSSSGATIIQFHIISLEMEVTY